MGCKSKFGLEICRGSVWQYSEMKRNAWQSVEWKGHNNTRKEADTTTFFSDIIMVRPQYLIKSCYHQTIKVSQWSCKGISI